MTGPSLTVVLDDDPTGTQSATDVTVLLRWDVDAIAEVLASEGSVYLQTNSRAIDEAAATALAERIRGELGEVSRRLGREILVLLRGDSTLRGHVFAEADVFAGDDGRVLFVPAFPQGGRTTIGSVHRVVIDGVDTPVGETEFAADPVFGYRSSDLVEWTRERGGRRAIPVPLEALRSTAGGAVAEALAAAGPRLLVVPDVQTDDDIRLVHAGLQRALADGAHVVVRSAATLAALCAGRLSTGYLSRPIRVEAGGVLVVCGSHTGAASAQLARLTDSLGYDPVVIATDDAFADPDAAGAAAAQAARELLARHPVVVVSTERVRRTADDTLAHGELVMRALMAATTPLVGEVGAVVSKGGITSAEVARVAFAASRARVRGQVAAGISVWDLGAGDRHGVQVVVPGNVGGAETLVDVVGALGEGNGAR
ncbi:four-carbon acid sugar kinase family protein [Pseudolysinimonas kribbensis]|uniref:Four-carbon acid sugar kinase family protein n=1 Tax=Pseudolysinimonas kribbensis TaxID=433641 RepID=A0ABQ6K2M6_9MICO|nr:four-carbon acid sugar kinase family protein [Pseudolysinimonas kribbensis]GMA94873.1 hypothetical protein GCM10025881_16970 [Pseudolysinimonas kribbensis]